MTREDRRLLVAVAEYVASKLGPDSVYKGDNGPLWARIAASKARLRVEDRKARVKR